MCNNNICKAVTNTKASKQRCTYTQRKHANQSAGKNALPVVHDGCFYSPILSLTGDLNHKKTQVSHT